MTRRLDAALVAGGLARSRAQATELIRNGAVKVNGHPARRASQPVGASDELTAVRDPWVSRAAHKLLGALDGSGLPVPERVLDAGAATGGFTQVLLARGAQIVYAIDVGHDQLAPALRADPRVRVREGLNLRALRLADLDDRPVSLVVSDVSFISLRMLLCPLFAVLAPGGRALLMIKPQFEVGRERIGSGGTVRSAADRAHTIKQVISAAAQLGWAPGWRADSTLPGPAGNLEHFVCFERCGGRTDDPKAGLG